MIKLSKKEDLTGYKMDFAPKQDKHYPGTKLYNDAIKEEKYPSYFTVSREELKETKYFKIHYSKKKGFHAVPEFPSKGALKE